MPHRNKIPVLRAGNTPQNNFRRSVLVFNARFPSYLPQNGYQEFPALRAGFCIGSPFYSAQKVPPTYFPELRAGFFVGSPLHFAPKANQIPNNPPPVIS